jgi:hypothetical protein
MLRLFLMSSSGGFFNKLTHLQHILSAVATNIFRFVRWRMGTPWAKTRISRFAALAA